ncbi:hypothetical protein NSTCB13_07225 [Nostoc sp. DSM 114160]|jgi:hypothetical protein
MHQLGLIQAVFGDKILVCCSYLYLANLDKITRKL